ncbi:cytochrome p450 [Fusarium napiforme]|uniref:Cytochrome p450 n=1 Tax=Fusarium napiforme TaxID=42672 RepID=A0A8H5JK15_9HYPO|nr:cytochrome p450 [Fusarium napiforme]
MSTLLHPKGMVGATIENLPPSMFFLLPPLLFFLISRLVFCQRKNYPNVPWLTLSNLDASAGTVDDATAFVQNGHKVIVSGYEKYTKKGLSFMMRTPQGGQFVYHPKYIEEVRSASESDLYNLPANNDLMQTRHTMHKNLEWDQYHFEVVGKQLTQNLGPGLPLIVDECGEWKSIHMFPTAFKITTRTANRLLFGPKLARDEEFLQLAIDYSDTFFAGANTIRHYPEWFKPIAMYLKTGVYAQMRIARKHLYPLLKERIANMKAAEASGKQSEFQQSKPADVVQWVLDITPPEKLDLEILTLRLLHILTAAVHTSSVTFLNAIYDLSQHPEIHDELRQEIIDVFVADGGKWTKQGLTKLMKLDSFMKESARWHPMQAGTMDRIAMRDYTLKDGLKVPKGTYMLTPSSASNLDPEVWGPDVLEFDPWRFHKLRQAPGQATQHSMVQTSPKFTYFGHGKHACPGRFFAVNELKVLLTYTLIHYDVRFPEGEPEPELMWFSGKTMPAMQTRVQWKKRTDAKVPWEDVSEGLGGY